jgi:hypothetical protein
MLLRRSREATRRDSRPPANHPYAAYGIAFSSSRRRGSAALPRQRQAAGKQRWRCSKHRAEAEPEDAFANPENASRGSPALPIAFRFARCFGHDRAGWLSRWRLVMTRQPTFQLKCSAAELRSWQLAFGRGCVSAAARRLLNAAALVEGGGSLAREPDAVELCAKYGLPRAQCLCPVCKDLRKGEVVADGVCALTGYEMSECLCSTCERSRTGRVEVAPVVPRGSVCR